MIMMMTMMIIIIISFVKMLDISQKQIIGKHWKRKNSLLLKI
jgi:hypothetical protein